MTLNNALLGTRHKVSGPQNADVPPDALRASGGIAALTSFATGPFGAKRASEPVASPTFGWPSQAAPARLQPKLVSAAIVLKEIHTKCLLT